MLLSTFDLGAHHCSVMLSSTTSFRDVPCPQTRAGPLGGVLGASLHLALRPAQPMECSLSPFLWSVAVALSFNAAILRLCSAGPRGHSATICSTNKQASDSETPVSDPPKCVSEMQSPISGPDGLLSTPKLSAYKMGRDHRLSSKPSTVE